MKQVYSGKSMAFHLLFALSLLLSQVSLAQHPTTVLSSAECNFVINFNVNDGNFGSPSIYSGDDDFTMMYDFTNGWWEEVSGRIAGVGETSIISPVFINPEDGATVVGFYYEAPLGSQYRVRVVTSSLDPNQEILATSANGPIWTALPATSGALCLRIQDLDIFAGQTLRYEVSFRAAVPGDIIFDDFQLSVAGAPLPVTFLGFVSRREPDGSVRLLWDVADEVNVRGYEVERSTDGRTFTRIGFVDATGSKRYSYDDATTIKGTYYYRVRNVDYDQQYKYTGILRVSIQGPTVNTIQLYPVPARDYVYLQHEKVPAKGVVRVISVDGRVMKRIETVPNSMQTNIILTGLKAGLYLVQYDDGEGNSETLKLVKQ
jgi:hypothetical protein